MLFTLHVCSNLAFVTKILPDLKNELFSVSQTLGLGEGFQYVKEFWITLLFGWLLIRTRRALYLGFGFLFTCFLIYDMFSFHELVGEKLPTWVGLSPTEKVLANVRIEDMGELLIVALVGILFFSSSGSHRRVGPCHERNHRDSRKDRIFLFPQRGEFPLWAMNLPS